MRGETVVNGQKIDTTYNSDGYDLPWTARVGDETVRSASESGLIGKIRTALKRQEVPIHVEFVAPTGRRGAVVGQHAGRNISIVMWDDGSRETIEIVTPLRADTDMAALRALRTAERQAKAALAAFLAEHQMLDGARRITDTTHLLRAERRRLTPDTETERAGS
jgi:hypothetical protein